jgi:hypothetical protein
LPVGNGLAKPGPVLFPQDALRLQQESSGSGAGAVVATVGCSVLGMMLAGGIWSWRSQMGSSSYSAGRFACICLLQARVGTLVCTVEDQQFSDYDFVQPSFTREINHTISYINI